MFFLRDTALFALLPSFITSSPLPASSPLPPCGDKNVACKCPAGTTFGNYTTTGTIASYANAVSSVAYDYYQTDWFGLPTTKTQGPNNTPGVSIRTLPVTAKGTTYDLVEKLTAQARDPRTGSFTWSFNQVNVGVKVPPEQGGGAFNGYWPSFSATQQRFNPVKTDIKWDLYFCETGSPFEWAGFHEGAIKNISSILQKQGKLFGKSSEPVSVKNG